MVYEDKHLRGFAPFRPTQHVGFYLRTLLMEQFSVLVGNSGRMYLRQYWQEAGWLKRLVGVARQLPGALVAAVKDEGRNIRSRQNRRLGV